MGKARRLRDQRRRSGPWQGGDPHLIRTEADLAADPALTSSEMLGRVTYSDDPVLGGGEVVRGFGPDWQPIPDSTAQSPPVVLFEPTRSMVAQEPGTGLLRELRIEAITAAGFSLLQGGPVMRIEPALGWELRRVPGELLLRDGDGEIWASSKITPDPRWVSAAASAGSVIVYYGCRLGVRTPPGTDPARYGTEARRDEFRQARRNGLTAAAMVTWRGDAPAETLEWVTFLPGSLGHHLAGVFAPAGTLARYGGAAGFGLAPLPRYQHEIPDVRTVVARVSRTDIDLIDPGEDAGFGMLGGVRYEEGLPPAWLDAAGRDGRILVLTGSVAPGPAVRDDQLRELYAATVTVRFC